jgi:hypothetical protein
MPSSACAAKLARMASERSVFFIRLLVLGMGGAEMAGVAEDEYP